MPGYIGGSAAAMVDQISEGYCLVHQGTLKGMSRTDLQGLRAEIDKALREVRALVPPQNDPQQSQLRNRKIGRLSSVMVIVQSALSGRPSG
jgi:hypothetical protein